MQSKFKGEEQRVTVLDMKNIEGDVRLELGKS